VELTERTVSLAVYVNTCRLFVSLPPQTSSDGPLTANVEARSRSLQLVLRFEGVGKSHHPRRRQDQGKVRVCLGERNSVQAVVLISD
jgi:hypothetical protein